MYSPVTAQLRLQKLPPSLYYSRSTLHSHNSLSLLGLAFASPKDIKAGTLRCGYASIPGKEDDLQLMKWKTNSIMTVDAEDLEQLEPNQEKIQTPNEIRKYVEIIRSMLLSMGDGEINMAPYDTAWVALIEDKHDGGGPQFPSSLDWIANNQLLDGSWGDEFLFHAQDRLLNSAACVIALKRWSLYPDKVQKGMSFIKENMGKLENVNSSNMLSGFEIIFPSLLDIAKTMNIEILDDSTALKEIYARRDLKLERIPRKMLHTVPTTLLYSLEGMDGLEWEKLLKLQSHDGSFLFSPSATAFAFMQTKDENCLKYLSRIVDKFNGGVPCFYPLDLFESMWVLDRLERLGISRYFPSEINGIIDHIARYWTKDGVFITGSSRVCDIDSTSMGFRVLRLHGREVSAEVFQNFKKDDEFHCFGGQSSESVTVMFNLYRASQVLFPGEKILEEAKNFSSKFLAEKQGSNQLLDKWIIAKDIPGEVAYALELPWYASLARIETRFYLEHYGGGNDVWIAKTLFRLPFVSNNTYLELARSDYNKCQAIHQLEWDCIQKWYRENNLEEYGMSQRSILLVYYLAAASIYEPERSNERLAWAKTAALMETIVGFFEKNGNTSSQRRSDFINNFTKLRTEQRLMDENSTGIKHHKRGREGETDVLMWTLLETLSQLSLSQDKEIRYGFHQAWEKWMMAWQEIGTDHGMEAELLVRIINLSGGRWMEEELSPSSSSRSSYQTLFSITNRVCQALRQVHQQQQYNMAFKNKKCKITAEIDRDMQELVQLVLSASSDGMDPLIKKAFLLVAKSYYYAAYCIPSTIDFHIAKVLFEKVV